MALARFDRIEGPHRQLAGQAIEQSRAGEARFGDLGGADRVVEGRGLAAPGRVEGVLADAVVKEVALHSVGRAEVEMAPVRRLEEARGAEILVVADGVD